jgi:hypothetical protein
LRLGFKISNLLIKSFEGSSEAFRAPYRQAGKQQGVHENTWRLKNDASLLAISVDSLQYDILLKMNGGNKSFLRTKGFEVLDYRKYTKLKLQKSVLYDSLPRLPLVGSRKGERRVGISEKSADPLTQLNPTSHSDEADKVAKIDLLKKDMFDKYFAKDDYMVSIEQAIYSQGSFKREEGKVVQNQNAEKYFEGIGNLADIPEVSDKEMIQLSSFTKCCSGLKNLFTCCKKSKKKRKYVSVEIDAVEKEVLSSSGRGLEKNEVVDEEELLILNPHKKKTTSLKKPSEMLIDRFTRHEVPWAAKTMEETRTMKGSGSLFGQSSSMYPTLEAFDLYLEMESQWDGETVMEMRIANKTIILLPDFLYSFMNFFKKPFSGRAE